MPAAAANANFSAQRDRSMQLANNGKTPLQSGGPPRLRLIRPNNPYVALGVAVNHLMGKPAFANLRFGDWSRALVGQINREHYYFAISEIYRAIRRHAPRAVTLLTFWSTNALMTVHV
jgi:hypothetical protein